MASSNLTTSEDLLSEIDQLTGYVGSDRPEPLGQSTKESTLSEVDRLTLGGAAQPSDEDSDLPFPVGDELLGRVIETSIRAARGFMSVPAGVEELAAGAAQQIGLDLPQPLETFQERTILAQEITREAFGLDDPSAVANIGGEVIGAIASGHATLKGIRASGPLAKKILGQRLGPAIHKYLSMPEMILASKKSEKVAKALPQALGLAAEGALFEAGRTPDAETKNILLGGLFGLAGGTATSALAIRRGTKARQMLGIPDEFPSGVLEGVLNGRQDVPARLTKFLAQTDANEEVLKAASILEETVDDQTLAATALSLQEAGEKGAIGSVRGIRLNAGEVEELAEAFPDYRFALVEEEDVGGTLLYGLQPELREGDRAFGYLTDSAIDFYERNGFMLGQRAVVKGRELEVVGITKDAYKVRDPVHPATSWNVPRDEVQFLDDVTTSFGSEGLFARFRQFHEESGGSWDEAFEEFSRSLPEFQPALRRPLRRFFVQKEAARLNRRLTPEAAQDLARFRRLQRQVEGDPEIASGLEERAAARGFMVTNVSGGRVKLTRVEDGRTALFPSGRRANEYLQNYRVDNAIDLTPEMGDVPAEIFNGTVRAGAPPNPSKPPNVINRSMESLFERPEKGPWREFFFRRFLRFAQLAEDRGKEFEELLGEPVWSAAMQPVSEGATKAMNRSAGKLERLRKVVNLVENDRADVIDGWLRSELKETFEQANNMTPKEIRAAKGLRSIFNDLFDDLAEAAGTSLSADDWFRNYAPDIEEYIEVTGSVDRWEQIFGRQGDELPPEVRFFGEMFKTGEATPGENIFTRAAKTIRAGYFKAEAGDAFEQAVQFAKTVDDPEAQQFLADYLMAQRGFPENSLEELTKMAEDLFSNLGVNVTKSGARGIVNDLWTLNIGALMGWRPGLVLRNMIQPLQLMAPILPNGFRRTVSAMRKASTKAAREYAEEIGAVRKQMPISRSEITEDVAGSLGLVRRKAQGLVRSSMKPYASADEWNRAVSAVAVRDNLNRAREAWEAGEMTLQNLVRHGGLHIQDGPVQGEFLRLLDAEGFEAARDFAAREMSNFTQFLYGSNNAAQWVRTGFGKMFGNYSTWPMGYLNWVRKAAAAPTWIDKASILFKHGAVNAALYSMKGLRINLLSWVPFASVFYTGGPFTQAGKDIHTVLNGGVMQARGYDPPPDYNLALSRMPEHLSLVIPGSTLFRSDVRRGLERAAEDSPVLGILESLGVRTTNPGPVEVQ